MGESREAGNSRVRDAGGRPDGETGLCPGYKQPGGPGALAVWKWWCAGEQVYGYVEAGWEGRWKRSEKQLEMIRLILVGDEDDLNCPLAGEWRRGYYWGRCFAEEEPTGLHWGRHQGQGALPVDSQGPHVSGRLCCFLRVVFRVCHHQWLEGLYIQDGSSTCGSCTVRVLGFLRRAWVMEQQKGTREPWVAAPD